MFDDGARDAPGAFFTGESHASHDLCGCGGSGFVLFVGENENGHFWEAFVVSYFAEFCAGFVDAFDVVRVHDVDECVGVLKEHFPPVASCVLSAHVEDLHGGVSDLECFGVEPHGGDSGGLDVFEGVEETGFSRVVQSADENEFGFVEETVHFVVHHLCPCVCPRVAHVLEELY